MKFKNIKQIPNSHYAVNVPWDSLADNLTRYQKSYDLDLDPEFQRGHIWTEAQQIKYVEFILSGGQSGRDIYFNCPAWMKRMNGQMVLIDGKQRLVATQRFLDNELKVFAEPTGLGYYFSEFKDRMPFDIDFKFHVNDVTDYNELLEWYISLNSGVAHTDEELQRVRGLITKEE